MKSLRARRTLLSCTREPEQRGAERREDDFRCSFTSTHDGCSRPSAVSMAACGQHIDGAHVRAAFAHRSGADQRAQRRLLLVRPQPAATIDTDAAAAESEGPAGGRAEGTGRARARSLRAHDADAGEPQSRSWSVSRFGPTIRSVISLHLLLLHQFRPLPPHRFCSTLFLSLRFPDPGHTRRLTFPLCPHQFILFSTAAGRQRKRSAKLALLRGGVDMVVGRRNVLSAWKSTKTVSAAL